MLTARKIRLNVSEQDAATLEMMQGKCRGHYNWWVMKLRDGERWNWKNAKKTLAESRKFEPSIDQVYGKLLAEVYFRLDKAMQAFFRRVAAGEQPGFPRVRPRHQFFTLCYPALYVHVEGKTLLLPTGGGRGKQDKPYPTIRAKLTESVPAGYQEVAICRDARGHYHASFVYAVAEEAPHTGGVVAFEPGDQDAGRRLQRARPVLSHRWVQRCPLVQPAVRQTSLQARPLPEEVEALYPSLPGLSAGLGTEAQQTEGLSATCASHLITHKLP
jgi:hypothetical protein